MKTPIKKLINDMYDDIALSPSELEHIKAHLNTQTEENTSRRAHYRLTALMCTMIIGVGLFLSISFSSHHSGKIDAIVEDVIDNHLSYKNLSYNATSLLELNKNFDYLGFALSKSKPISKARYGNLIGAKPCFILNIPAAQLRYQKDKHSWSTIFQTRYDEAIYGPIPDITKQEQPLAKVDRGIEVKLWQDQGLLFAVAQIKP